MEIYAASDILQGGEKLRDACLLAVNLAKQIQQQATRYKDDRATNFAQAHGNLATPGRRMQTKTIAITSGGIIIGLFLVLHYVLPLILSLMVRR